MTNITSLAQAFAQIEKCNFTCEAGPLENNVAWRIIKAAALTASAEREATLAEALKWIDYHADNQDLNHVDYRVQAATLARQAITKYNAAKDKT